jgi:hypothetical protein
MLQMLLVRGISYLQTGGILFCGIGKDDRSWQGNLGSRRTQDGPNISLVVPRTEAMPGSDAAENEQFRMTVLERALAENTRQIGELMRTLSAMAGSAMAGAPASGEKRNPEPIIIDADGVSPFAAGFHRRETDATGRHYRWTGKADYFELRFDLDRNGPWSFEMILLGNSHVDLAKLRAFVDYAEIPVRMHPESGAVCGSIPARPFANLVTLTFYLPGRFVPSELDPSSPDRRSLSAVFYQIELTPDGGRASTDEGLGEALGSPSVPQAAA